MTGLGADANLLQDVLIAIGLFGGLVIYRKTNVPRQTIKDLQDRIGAQDQRIKTLEEGRRDDAKTIGILEGQVRTYKELPLRELADGIKEVSDSNKAILKELQLSATVSAKAQTDGGLLVKTKDADPLEIKT